MISKRSSETSSQQALQAQNMKKGGYTKKKFKKGKDNSKG